MTSDGRNVAPEDSESAEKAAPTDPPLHREASIPEEIEEDDKGA
jgi:hypothetical protein